MYGINAPLGLIPQSSLTGATWNNQTRAYEIAATYATVISKGDPVKRLADGTIGVWNPATDAAVGILGTFQACFYLTNFPTVGNAVSADYWPGVANVATGGNGFANTPQALVVDDPNVVYSVQVSQSGTAGGVANPIVPLGVTLAMFGCNISFDNRNNVLAQNLGFATVFPSTAAGTSYVPPNNPGPGTAANNYQSGFYADLNTMSNTATVVGKIIGFDKSTFVGQVPYTYVNPIQNGVFTNALVIINNDIYKGGTGTIGTGTAKTTGP